MERNLQQGSISQQKQEDDIWGKDKEMQFMWKKASSANPLN